tara:strand:- start:140 stop:388 length:249 start_codon:yes stop_codon:yes gene_type:complete
MAIITTMNGVPLFDNIGEALVYGAARGLSGYHTHIFQGQLGYMGGATHAQATGTANSNNITPTGGTGSTGGGSTGGGGGGGY